VADATAEITKKLRDYQNRIERLEKVEALSLSDELAHALGAGIAASAGVALDASRHDHIHEITASDNPGGKVSLLQTDASGHLTIVQLNTTANHTTTTLTDHIGEHTAAHGVVVDNAIVATAGIRDVTAWGSKISQRTLIIANNGVAQLGAATTINGIVFVVNRSQGASAMFVCQGGGHTTVEMSDPIVVFSVTAGTAGTNVYWSAGNSRYEIQNKVGSEVYYAIFEFSQLEE
jgi:hypothetical protein